MSELWNRGFTHESASVFPNDSTLLTNGSETSDSPRSCSPATRIRAKHSEHANMLRVIKRCQLTCVIPLRLLFKDFASVGSRNNGGWLTRREGARNRMNFEQRLSIIDRTDGNQPRERRHVHERFTRCEKYTFASLQRRLTRLVSFQRLLDDQFFFTPTLLLKKKATSLLYSLTIRNLSWIHLSFRLTPTFIFYLFRLSPISIYFDPLSY